MGCRGYDVRPVLCCEGGPTSGRGYTAATAVTRSLCSLSFPVGLRGFRSRKDWKEWRPNSPRFCSMEPFKPIDVDRK